MLSRRLESGLSTDELRTILCRVTMRNTRFTWVRGQEMGSVSAPTPSSGAQSAHYLGLLSAVTAVTWLGMTRAWTTAAGTLASALGTVDLVTWSF